MFPRLKARKAHGRISQNAVPVEAQFPQETIERMQSGNLEEVFSSAEWQNIFLFDRGTCCLSTLC
jgi:hypothetical protein